MKAINKLFVFIFLIILSGCAQKLPSYKEGYGMVAVPYHFINRTDMRFLHTYEWKSSSDKKFSVKVQEGTYSQDVALSGLIPAGNYTIDTIIIRQVADPGIIMNFKEIEEKIEPPFDIYISPGTITIAPIVYEFEQAIVTSAIRTTPNVHNLKADEEQFYIDRIKKRENFNQWSIEIDGKEVFVGSTFQKSITENNIQSSPSNYKDEEEFISASEFYKSNEYTEALNIWLDLAKRGDAESSFKIAGMYDWGEGVEQSYTKSFRWYLESAKRGYGEAQCVVANRYDAGTGVRKNGLEAYRWYLICNNNNRVPENMRRHARGMISIIWNSSRYTDDQLKKIESEVKDWNPKFNLRPFKEIPDS